MSDPRFARLKTDPRFRRIKKDKHKVVVDERFKEVFADISKSKEKKGKARVDKYGRPLTDDHDQENLRRFYRLGDEDEAHLDLDLEPGPDYARGEGLLESSDEDDSRLAKEQNDEDSDSCDIVTLGRDVNQPIPVPGDAAEVDLDEDAFADLDAQVEAYVRANPEATQSASSAQQTHRLAVVNLDWDHVRAIHLFKIFSSLVSPTGAPVAPTSRDPGATKSPSIPVLRGKVLSVRVYPSEFGKERMAREEKQGPPAEIFKRKRDLRPEDINERTVYELGDGEDYDEDALRKYQLERLRYYYAIVECDTVDSASFIFNELDGTELERSANVFDLSFVPDDMSFDQEFRDEANADLSTPYKPLEFVTDALRHSKVKLTWDEDEPERTHITRRVLSRKDIEENDFRAYIASSSESEPDDAPRTSTSTSKARSKGKERDRNQKTAERNRLRALLLAGGDDAMPEGWGHVDDAGDDVDMEITFTPGLNAGADVEDETTLETYQRKMREKKKKRKEELREYAKNSKDENKAAKSIDDDFFGGDSDDESAEEAAEDASREKNKRHVKGKGKGKRRSGDDELPSARIESTVEELALLAASDNRDGEVKHFDMKAVLRAEKKRNKHKKGGKSKKGADDGENELQEDFSINVKDERFKSVLEDHTFAIDPSNPHFKKTKSMSALLEERSRRQQDKAARNSKSAVAKANPESQQPDLRSLVESVKRKSAASDKPAVGKRRKVV